MKYNKLMSVLLASTLVVGAFTGCSGGAASKETTAGTTKETTVAATEATTDTTALKGEITVLTQRTDLVDSKFKDYVKKFNTKNPDVTVKFEALTNYETDVPIRMSTTEYGDVLMLPNSVKSNQFAEFFEPLGTVEEFSDKYTAAFITAKQSAGIVYGLPSNANAQGIVYNKKVFAEAGITTLPKTPEEFLAALQKIKDKGTAIPYYTNYAAGWTLTQWEDHAFGSITGNANYHNNEMVKEEAPFAAGTSHYTVYKLMYDIVKNGLAEKDPVTADWEKSKVMINNGEIGAMFLGSWAISQMQAAGPNAADIGYMAFPSNKNGVQYATAGADYCYGINKNSENKEAARAWIDFMVDESGFALSEGSISIVKSDPMPDTLAAFTGVEFVVDLPAEAENEGLFDELSNQSEIGLYTEVEKVRIIDAAMGSTTESFDDIMNDWNARWAAAQKEVVKK